MKKSQLVNIICVPCFERNFFPLSLGCTVDEHKMICCTVLQAKSEKIEQLEIDLNISEKVQLNFFILFYKNIYYLLLIS